MYRTFFHEKKNVLLFLLETEKKNQQKIYKKVEVTNLHEQLNGRSKNIVLR